MRKHFINRYFKNALNLRQVIPVLYLLSIILFQSCKPEDKPKIDKGQDTARIASTVIKYVMIDLNGKKWFAGDKGISSFNDTVWVNYNTEDGIPAGVINALENTESITGSVLWLASDNGLGRLSAKSGKILNSAIYTHLNQASIKNDTILSLHQDNSEIIWVGTKSGVACLKDSAKWISPSGLSYAMRNFPITSISSGLEGWNYFATYGGGIARNISTVDAVTGASTYETPYAGLPSDSVLSMYIVDSTGNQWFGTNQGIAYHIGTETKKNWTVYNKDSGLISNMAYCIIQDFQGAVWIGTDAGVSKLVDSHFTNYTIADGLADNTVYSMALDRDGSIWFATGNGVSHYNGNWSNYSPNLSLP